MLTVNLIMFYMINRQMTIAVSEFYCRLLNQEKPFILLLQNIFKTQIHYFYLFYNNIILNSYSLKILLS